MIKSFLKSNKVKQNNKVKFNVEALEDRCTPANFDFVGNGINQGALWSNKANWLENGAVTNNLPGPNDKVILNGVDNVVYDINANTTIKELVMDANGTPSLHLDGPTATGKLLTIGDATLAGGKIWMITAGANPQTSNIAFNGKVNWTDTNIFGDPVAKGATIGKVFVNNTARVNITGNNPTTFNVEFNIGEAGGNGTGTVVIEKQGTNPMFLGNHGQINIRSSGKLVLKSGMIDRSKNVNTNNLINAGTLRTEAPDEFYVAPTIVTTSGGKIESKGKSKMGGMESESGSTTLVWGGSTLKFDTDGNGATFNAGSSLHLLNDGTNSIINIEGSVDMYGDLFTYAKATAYVSSIEDDFSMSTIGTGSNVNTVLNLNKGSWSSIAWNQYGAMNSNIIYDANSDHFYNTVINSEDSFYGNGNLNVDTTVINGVAIDSGKSVNLLNGVYVGDGFTLTQTGGFTSWVKNYDPMNPTLFGLIVGENDGPIDDPIDDPEEDVIDV